MSAPNIAVFLQNKPYLGNQIALIPFFHELKKIYPGHGIVTCAHQSAAGALMAMGYIDRLVKHRPDPELSAFELISTMRSLNIEHAFTFRRHAFLAGFLARLSARKLVVGFTARTTRLFLSQSVSFNVKTYAAQNALALINRQLTDFSTNAAPQKRGYFLIIPGGSLKQKKYPLERYIAIAQRLSDIAPVHFLLGEDMNFEVQTLALHAQQFTLHVGRPLPEVADIIKQSAVVIANDCGPVHFAHIFDIPRVVLFAIMAKAANWFYPTQNAHLLKAPAGEDIGNIDMEEIIGTARALYPI